MTYVHFVHVNGEIGDVDDELILGPLEGVQMTYCWLRETKNGENIAVIRDGQWWTAEAHGHLGSPKGPFSDVHFTAAPEFILDHHADDHDWETCSTCVDRAVRDEILSPGSRPLRREIA